MNISKLEVIKLYFDATKENGLLMANAFRGMEKRIQKQSTN
jgi:hypothetical protein